jgi:hypothetical protein
MRRGGINGDAASQMQPTHCMSGASTSCLQSRRHGLKRDSFLFTFPKSAISSSHRRTSRGPTVRSIRWALKWSAIRGLEHVADTPAVDIASLQRLVIVEVTISAAPVAVWRLLAGLAPPVALNGAITFVERLRLCLRLVVIRMLHEPRRGCSDKGKSSGQEKDGISPHFSGCRVLVLVNLWLVQVVWG